MLLFPLLEVPNQVGRNRHRSLFPILHVEAQVILRSDRERAIRFWLCES